MKNRTVVLIAVASVAIACPRPACAQQEDAHGEIETVLADFVRGWREGDAETLERVLALDAGYVQWVSGEGDDEHAESMAFRHIVARNRANSDYGLAGWEIVSLDVVDDQLAAAKLAVQEDEVVNLDYLVLYRVAGDWKIVSNTFVILPK
jgi:hypothetical protein